MAFHNLISVPFPLLTLFCQAEWVDKVDVRQERWESYMGWYERATSQKQKKICLRACNSKAIKGSMNYEIGLYNSLSLIPSLSLSFPLFPFLPSSSVLVHMDNISLLRNKVEGATFLLVYLVCRQ